MTVRIENRQTLAGIPSASGIELINGNIYVIGDDSPWLYQLDTEFRLIKQTRLGDVLPPADGGRVPKLQKHDLEAMALFRSGRGTELLLFGSGSRSPERDSLARIPVAPPGEARLYSVRRFYDQLQAAAGLPDEALNVEAAVVHAGTLYLFNRGDNLIAACPLDNLLAHLEEDALCPTPAIYRIELPELEGSPAGFSGATLLPDGSGILFTASVEHTTNWIDDGEVTGSFIGRIGLPLTQPLPRPACAPILQNGEPLKIKVESVTVKDSPEPGVYQLLLVTDSDDGASEILEVILR